MKFRKLKRGNKQAANSGDRREGDEAVANGSEVAHVAESDRSFSRSSIRIRDKGNVVPSVQYSSLPRSRYDELSSRNGSISMIPTASPSYSTTHLAKASTRKLPRLPDDSDRWGDARQDDDRSVNQLAYNCSTLSSTNGVCPNPRHKYPSSYLAVPEMVVNNSTCRLDKTAANELAMSRQNYPLNSPSVIVDHDARYSNRNMTSTFKPSTLQSDDTYAVPNEQYVSIVGTLPKNFKMASPYSAYDVPKAVLHSTSQVPYSNHSLSSHHVLRDAEPIRDEPSPSPMSTIRRGCNPRIVRQTALVVTDELDSLTLSTNNDTPTPPQSQVSTIRKVGRSQPPIVTDLL